MLRRHFLRYENKLVSRYRDSYFDRVLAPEGELLSFAPPKESSQRKSGPITAHVLRSSHLSGDGRMGFLPICRRAASMPHPFGLFPTNTPVLDAANGEKARYCVTSVSQLIGVLQSIGVKNMFFIPTH